MASLFSTGLHKEMAALAYPSGMPSKME